MDMTIKILFFDDYKQECFLLPTITWVFTENYKGFGFRWFFWGNLILFK
jgi:hypothetical protein